MRDYPNFILLILLSFKSRLEELYLCYGKMMQRASYQQLNDVINILQHNEITDKIILQEDGGLRYKADVYWPDKRFKDIKPVGKYGGKAYIANLSEGNGAIYLAFINDGNCITWSSMPKLMNLRMSSYVIMKYPERRFW